MKHFLVILSLVFLIACGEDKPEDIMELSKFEKVMVDVYLVDAYVSQKIAQDDEEAFKNYGYYKSVFDDHNVTEKEFKKAFDYYSEDPEEFRGIVSRVLDKVSRKRTQK